MVQSSVLRRARIWHFMLGTALVTGVVGYGPQAHATCSPTSGTNFFCDDTINPYNVELDATGDFEVEIDETANYTGSGANSGSNRAVITIDAGSNDGEIKQESGSSITGGVNNNIGKGSSRDGIQIDGGKDIDLYIDGSIFADDGIALDLNGNSDTKYKIEIGETGVLGNSANPGDKIIDVDGTTKKTTINNDGTMHGRMEFDDDSGAVTVNNMNGNTWNTSGTNAYTNNNDTINNDNDVINTVGSSSTFVFKAGKDTILNQNGSTFNAGADFTTIYFGQGKDALINDNSQFTTSAGKTTNIFFDDPVWFIVPFPYTEAGDQADDTLENRNGATFDAFGNTGFYFGGKADILLNTGDGTSFNTNSSGLLESTQFGFGSGKDKLQNTLGATFNTDGTTVFYFDNPELVPIVGLPIPFTEGDNQNDDMLENNSGATFNTNGWTRFFFGGKADTLHNSGDSTNFNTNTGGGLNTTTFAFGSGKDKLINDQSATFTTDGLTNFYFDNPITALGFGIPFTEADNQNDDMLENASGATFNTNGITNFLFGGGKDMLNNTGADTSFNTAGATVFGFGNGKDNLYNSQGALFKTGDVTSIYFDNPDTIFPGIGPLPFTENGNQNEDHLKNDTGATFQTHGLTTIMFGGDRDTLTNTGNGTSFITSDITTFGMGSGKDTVLNSQGASFETNGLTNFFFDNPVVVGGVIPIPYTEDGPQNDDIFQNDSGATFTANDELGMFFGGDKDTFLNTGNGTKFTVNGLGLIDLGSGKNVFNNEQGAEFTSNFSTIISARDQDDMFYNQSGATFNANGLELFFFEGGKDEFHNRTGAVFNSSNFTGISFGDGNDNAYNSSVINVAGLLHFYRLEEFHNSVGGTGGLIDMRNANVGDGVSIFSGGNFNGGTDSMLGIDAELTPGGTADFLYVSGNVSGPTKLQVDDLDLGPGIYDPVGVQFAQVDGTTSEGDFFLDAPIAKGFFDYDVVLRPDSTSASGENEWVLANDINDSTNGLPQVMAGAMNLWHRSIGTWYDRTADLRQTFFNGGSTFGADLAPEDAVVIAEPSYGLRPGVWVKGYGGKDSRDIDTATGGDSYDQHYGGGLIGVDMAASPNLLLGVFGGYGVSDMDLDSPSDIDFDATSVGAYATYIDGGWFVDALFKADFGKANYSTTSGGVSDSFNTDYQAYGGQIGAGYRFKEGSWFIEPGASISYVHAQFDDASAFGNDIVFDDGESIRGRIGGRIGTTIEGGAVRYEPYVEANLWREFSGDFAPVLGTGGASVPITYDGTGNFAEIKGGINFFDVGNGWNAFANAGYQSGDDDYEGYTYQAGLRLQF